MNEQQEYKPTVGATVYCVMWYESLFRGVATSCTFSFNRMSISLDLACATQQKPMISINNNTHVHRELLRSADGG